MTADDQIDWAQHTTPREQPPLDDDGLGLWESIAAIALVCVSATIIIAALYSAWVWKVTP
jgi:anti-sigma-K factor RskA